ncbi:hypothetical protein RB195_015706 [Necator americanus]
MLLTAQTDFGLGMLRHASADEPVVVSPLSVTFALAMVQAGAKGNTREQIIEIISRSASDEQTLDYYSELSESVLKATDGVQCRIANGFYLDNKFEIEKDYEDTVAKKYSAKVERHDFSKADETAKIIDEFVSTTTEGKIHDIVNADTVRDAFSLIVNAIYFTAEWVHKFDGSGNTKQMFFSAEDKQREMEFMNDFEEHRYYAEDEDIQLLSLQYKDTAYAFNIFLPKKRFGLGELLKTIDGAKIQEMLSKLENTYISLTIPKMKIETDFKLKEALMQMGVTEMFSDKADLSGITTSTPLKISEAAHKAMIEVDEDGTTAAATTIFKVCPMSLTLEQPKQFIADHPFIFVLTKNNNPLFMGQLV